AGGDLLVFDTASAHTTDLTVNTNPADPAGASVLGVIDASDSGDSVYFVARGALEDDEGHVLNNAQGLRPASGADNVYLLHRSVGVWRTTFVDTLSSSDESDWTRTLYQRTSGVSADGRFVEFTSTASLTGFNNHDLRSDQPDSEVFIYDAATNRIVCASCDPSGVRPDGAASVR